MKLRMLLQISILIGLSVSLDSLAMKQVFKGDKKNLFKQALPKVKTAPPEGKQYYSNASFSPSSNKFFKKSGVKGNTNKTLFYTEPTLFQRAQRFFSSLFSTKSHPISEGSPQKTYAHLYFNQAKRDQQRRLYGTGPTELDEKLVRQFYDQLYQEGKENGYDALKTLYRRLAKESYRDTKAALALNVAMDKIDELSPKTWNRKSRGSEKEEIKQKQEERPEWQQGHNEENSEQLRNVIREEFLRKKRPRDKYNFNERHINKYRDYYDNNYYEGDIDDNGNVTQIYLLEYSMDSFIKTSEKVSEKVRQKFQADFMKTKIDNNSTSFNYHNKDKQRIVSDIDKKYYEVDLVHKKIIPLRYYKGEFIPSNEEVSKEVYSKFFGNTEEGGSQENPLYDQILRERIQNAMYRDRREFNKKHKDKYRYITYYNNYYEGHINLKDGTVIKVVPLQYVENIVNGVKNPLEISFVETEGNVSKIVYEGLQLSFMNDQIFDDHYSFNKEHRDQVRLRLCYSSEPDYYHLDVDRKTGKIKAIYRLKYQDGLFVKDMQTEISQNTREILQNIFMERLMNADETLFAKEKYRDQLRVIIKDDKNHKDSRYYHVYMNLMDGTVNRIIRLTYIDGEWRESLVQLLPEEHEKVLEEIKKQLNR